MSLKYVLITAARNEEAFIRLTLESVVSQSVLPLRWVIVSDGSTDRTDEIVGEYAAKHDWIRLLRLPERKERHFGGKATCVGAGYKELSDLSFDVVGCMDADLSFSPNYFMFLLEKLSEDPQLGIVGTPYREEGRVYDYRFSSIEHVSGACQVFRRGCFEAIGGYTPVKQGGIDVIAVLTARMKGWRTRTFPEQTCEHHRVMGSANSGNRVMAAFRLGEKQYCLGFHPLWQLCRSFYQMTHTSPYVIGGMAICAGYFSALIRRTERTVSQELIDFQQRDQLRRLHNFVGLRSSSSR